MDNSKNNLPIQLFISCLIGLLIGKFCFSTTKEKVALSLFNGKPSKLQSVINIIDNRYVDKVDIDSLVELVIPDVLKKLDPHSSYVPSVRINESERDIVGKYYGIGINLGIYYDTITVLFTYPNGPAEMAGIIAGDKIVMVDTTSVVGDNARELFSDALNYYNNSNMKIQVKRSGVDSLLALTVIQGDISLHSVPASYMIDSVTAYIKISNFGDKSYEEFLKKLISIECESITNLIIDLRGNPGGRVGQVRSIVSEILNYGDTIAYTVNRDGKVEDMYIDTTLNGICRNMRVVCMVNSSSASASELMAGAIQDNDRGLILGRRTFGKGLVQTPIQMPDGSMVKLTTLRYYTPSGRSLQKKYEDYEDDIYMRAINGELDSANAYIVKDSTTYRTKNGRIVYSKGGIQPDIFVPMKRTQSDLLFALDSLSILKRFAAKKYNDVKIDNKKIMSNTYIENIKLDSENTVNEMLEYARSKGVEINLKKDKKKIAEVKDYLYENILAYAYRIIGNEDMYYKHHNYDDSDIDSAISVLNSSVYDEEFYSKFD